MAPTRLRQQTILSHLYFLTLLSLSDAARIPAIIVFGDSTVDAGNNNGINTILKSNFPPYGRDFVNKRATGRFCNGRLPTDFISEAVGLPPLVPAYLDPAYNIKDFARGVTFASAGTGLDNATSKLLSVIPMWKEVEYFREYREKLRQYIGQANAANTVNEAIYVVSIGTNDFLENYFAYMTGRFMQLPVEQFEDFLVNEAAEFLTKIYRLGARKILFVGLSPFGCLPLERASNIMGKNGCNEDYNRVARDFNAKLQRMIANLRKKLPGVRLRYGPLYDSMLHVINNPSKYGIENVEQGCCAPGKYEMAYMCNAMNPLVCPDANKYLFWDAFHPTEKFNRLMSNLMLRTSLREFI